MRKLLPMAAAAVALTLAACDEKDHLPQGKMADLIVDLQLADAYASNHYEFASDSAKSVLRMSVLKKHGVTQEKFDQSLVWYAHNLENYTKLYGEVDKRLEKRQEKLLASSGHITDDGAGSMWPYSAMAMLSPLAEQDGVQFSIPVSDITPGEKLTWMMRLSDQMPSQMVLGVDYTDGSTAYALKRSTQKRLEMSLQTDSTLTVSRVYGYMKVENNSAAPVWADSISLRKYPFAKENYHLVRQQNYYRGPRRNEPLDTTKRHLTVKPITDNPVPSSPRPGEEVPKKVGGLRKASEEGKSTSVTFQEVQMKR